MKIVLSFLISLTPINALKIFFYRILLGYKISYNSKVGFFNIILSKEVTLQQAKIGSFNFIKVKKLKMQKNAWINKFNRIKNVNILDLNEKAIIFSWNFVAGIPELSTDKEMDFSKQNLVLGKTSELLRSNYIDLTYEVIIGDNVVFGGNGSEIWTHGYDQNRNFQKGSVVFGNSIFIGTNCIFTKSINISDNVIVAPGSVIYKSITMAGTYSTHQISKIN